MQSEIESPVQWQGQGCWTLLPLHCPPQEIRSLKFRQFSIKKEQELLNLSAEKKAINLCAYSQNKYVHLKFLNFYESSSIKGYIMNKTWSFLTKCIWKLCKIFSFVENSCFCLEKDFLLALTFPFFSDIDAFYNPTLKVNIYTIPDPSREVDKNESFIYWKLV